MITNICSVPQPYGKWNNIDKSDKRIVHTDREKEGYNKQLEWKMTKFGDHTRLYNSSDAATAEDNLFEGSNGGRVVVAVKAVGTTFW